MRNYKELLGILFLFLFISPALAGPLLPGTLAPNPGTTLQTKETTTPHPASQMKSVKPSGKAVSKKPVKNKTTATTVKPHQAKLGSTSPPQTTQTSQGRDEVDFLLSSPEAKKMYQQNLSLIQAKKEVELLTTQKQAAELKKQIKEFQKTETTPPLPSAIPPPNMYPGMGSGSGNSFYPPILQEQGQPTGQGGFRVVMSTGIRVLLEKDGQYFFCKKGDTVSGWEVLEVTFEGARFKNKTDTVYIPVTFSPAPGKLKEVQPAVAVTVK